LDRLDPKDSIKAGRVRKIAPANDPAGAILSPLRHVSFPSKYRFEPKKILSQNPCIAIRPLDRLPISGNAGLLF